MIKIDKHYSLTHDSLGWTLVYKEEGSINKNTGKPVIKKNSWHYSKMSVALKRYVDERMKIEGENKDVQSLLDRMARLEKVIERLSSSLPNQVLQDS
jgi:hypothetical protein